MLPIAELIALINMEIVGEWMSQFATTLFPLTRSITGDGVRRTLDRIAEQIPIERVEVPSGTHVLDWTVPNEWNVRDAYIKNRAGERVVDFREHNLHVVGYSVPIDRRVSREELERHLHSLPDHPDWIPYRTSYYRDNWGFCLTQRQRDALTEESYEVCIDSSLDPGGSLTYGECLLEGESDEEVLISCHICHPSLANDNLSGIAVATALAAELGRARRRLSYRFLFIPGTIGSISWLAGNEKRLGRIRAGLVLTCIGDRGALTYKRSRRGDAEVDRAMERVLAESGAAHSIEDFSPWGYDERQYCSPGFDLPVGCLMRTPHGQFPEYHTSADDLGLLDAGALGDSYAKCLTLAGMLERNMTPVSKNPKGEPQLGRRGIYRAIGGRAGRRDTEHAMLWVLNLADGQNDLLSIAERSGMSFAAIADAADLLTAHDLLEPLRFGPPETAPQP